MVWAFVDRANPDGDDPIGSFEMVERRPAPWADHPFGAGFRRARLHQRVSLRTVAERSGLTAAWISDMERGQEPPPATLDGWAALIDMTPEQLHAWIEREAVRKDEERRSE